MKPASSTRGRRPALAAECEDRDCDADVLLGVLPGLLGYNLRRAHQCSWRHYAATIGEGLRPGMFTLLVLAQENPGIAQVELGTHLGVDKASMVALLDRMERAGLIERRRSSRDRRRQGVFLTAAGAGTMGRMVNTVRQLEKQLASRYSKGELELFLSFLQRMYG